MIKHGVPPYYECSSHGDKRFSAFYAKIKNRNNKSIEEIYQSSKIFNGIIYSNWRDAKGKVCINQQEVTELYSILWDEYIDENIELLDILLKQSGLCDKFGQKNHVCQATELWRIRNKYLHN